MLTPVEPNGVNDFADPIQRDLLETILLDSEPAAAATKAWLTQHCADHGGLATIEAGAHRLLPLLSRHLKNLSAPAVESELKRIHRDYWAQNQRLFYRLERLLNWFSANGIPTIVLKGPALSVLHYRDMTARPMGDLDVMVPEEMVCTVVQSLVADGWVVDWEPPDLAAFAYFYRHRHALPMVHVTDGDLDLHWQVLYTPTSKGASRVFWEASVPLTIRNVETRALCPTDQVLQACVHGFDGNPIAPIRWIVDTMSVIRTSTIDWDRLLRISRELHLTIPMSQTLLFLADAFHVDVPRALITQLSSERVSAAERRYFEHRRRPGAYSWRQILSDVLERHRHCTRDLGMLRRAALLPYAFQMHWRLPRLGALGGHGIAWFNRHFARFRDSARAGS